MREKTGESLSALLDTQADDLDLQRVLNALDGDAEVSRQWRRYNVISAAMRNELGHFAVDPTPLGGHEGFGDPGDEAPRTGCNSGVGRACRANGCGHLNGKVGHDQLLSICSCFGALAESFPPRPPSSGRRVCYCNVYVALACV